jgi:hypothetical protein
LPFAPTSLRTNTNVGVPNVEETPSRILTAESSGTKGRGEKYREFLSILV